jgi:hypothetical protein
MVGKTRMDAALHFLNDDNRKKMIDIISHTIGFIKPMADLATKLDISPSDAEDAAKILESAAKILYILGGDVNAPDGKKYGLVGYLANGIGGIAEVDRRNGNVLRNDALIRQAVDVIHQFSWAFGFLAAPLGQVIKTINTAFPDADDSENAAKVMASTKTIMEALPSLIDNMIGDGRTTGLAVLASKADQLTNVLVAARQIAGKQVLFSDTLRFIFWFMNEAIVKPISEFGGESDVKEAEGTLAALNSLSAFMGAPLLNIVDAITKVCGDFGNKNMNFNCAGAVQAIVRGVGEMAKALSGNDMAVAIADLDAAGGNLEQLDRAMARVAGLLQNVQAKMAGVAGGVQVGGLNITPRANMVVQTAPGGNNSGLDMHQQVAMAGVNKDAGATQIAGYFERFVAAHNEYAQASKKAAENLTAIRSSVSNVTVNGGVSKVNQGAALMGTNLTGGRMQEMPNVGNGMGRVG